MRRTLMATGVVILFAIGGEARAHDADIIFVRAAPLDDGRVREVATLTGGTLALLAPVDPNGDGIIAPEELADIGPAVDAGFWDSAPLFGGVERCEREGSRIALRETYLELTAEFRCAPGALRQEFRVLSLLPAGYRVVLGTYGQGGDAAQRFAEGNQQTLYLTGEGGVSEGPSGFGGWVLLGAEHILEGYDHLAFLLGLVLVATTWRRLLLMVTAFTVAHSITLGATAMGVFTLSESAGRWVEIAIAASVVFVAVENLIGVHEKWRPVVTFVFGLIHGFGFASVLAGYGLGQSAALALAGFNLGVELGQAAIVAVIFPNLVVLYRRPRAKQWIIRGGSAGVAALGLYWLVVRVAGL